MIISIFNDNNKYLLIVFNAVDVAVGGGSGVDDDGGRKIYSFVSFANVVLLSAFVLFCHLQL